MKTEAEEAKVKYKSTSSILDITLNDPTKLNALSGDMIIELVKIIGSFSQPSIEQYKGFIPLDIEFYKLAQPQVVLIQGNDKAFCSGGNITDIYKGLNEPNEETYNILYSGYQSILTLIHLLYFMKPIQISIWTGWVMGGGVGISINSPIRIATESTVFAMPECQIGLFPDVGGSYFLTRLFNKNPKIGLYVGLTGHRIKGKDCLITGIATHFVSQNDLQSVKHNIEALCTQIDNVTLEDINLLLNQKCLSYKSEDFKFENEDIINKVFILDSIFDIYERLRKFKDEGNEREKNFACDTLKILEKSSQLSLLIFTELCKKAKNYKDITQQYRTDIVVAVNAMIKGEFKEGIRATLIDRDRKYNWKYKTIEDLKEEKRILDEFVYKVLDINTIKTDAV